MRIDLMRPRRVVDWGPVVHRIRVERWTELEEAQGGHTGEGGVNVSSSTRANRGVPMIVAVVVGHQRQAAGDSAEAAWRPD